MNKNLKIVIVLMSMLFLASCSEEKHDAMQQEAARVITVTEKPNVVKLYYSGTIKPIHIETVTSDVEGTVASVNFRYGQVVKKGERLMGLSSTKLEEEFHEAVKSFLKAKDQFLNSKVSFAGAKELYSAKIISRQEYVNEKSQHQNNELAFIDARHKLEQMIQSVPSADKTLEELSLRDISKIKDIFEETLDDIPVHSPENGIILFPVKKSGKDDTSKDSMEVGLEIKKGQALVSIGDLSGISIEFVVGENDINRVMPGQKVMVIINALESGKLPGVIEAVGVQAKDAGGNGDSAEFPVVVKVPKIGDKQRQHLRVGMTAKIEIDLVGAKEMMIPIAAVQNQQGKHVVTVINAQGKDEIRVVTVGRTTLNDVVIKSGLQPGEKIRVND